MVPNGWEVKPLSSITKWSSGGTPSKNNPDYWNGEIPWISAVSMRGHYFEKSELKITDLAVSNGAKMAPKNSLLLLVRGSMLWNKIPVGIAARRVSFNQDVKCLVPHADELTTEFLLYWFLTYEHRLMNMVTGTGIGAGKLDTTDLQGLDVFIPPLSEQRKIAKILSCWDKSIATTEKLIAASKQQKKALMQQLLTGKKRLVDPETGKAFEGEWEKKVFSNFFDIGSSKRILQSEWKESGIPFFRTRELVSLANRKPFSSEIFISKKLYSAITDKYGKPKSGDFLVSGVGTLGISYLVKESDEFYFKDGNVLWFKSLGNINSKFFRYCFESDLVQNQIINQTTITTVGTYTITNAKQTKFLCPPNHREQQKIASVLTAADKEIKLLEQKLSHLKNEKKALMQQLLTGKRRVKCNGY